MGFHRNERGLFADVYEAVDNSIALGRCLPAAQANVQRALVHLRRSEGDPEAVRQLESMSVHLHQLTAATMRPQQTRRDAAVAQLSILAREWMARLPMH
jgi:hypothetical protein